MYSVLLKKEKTRNITFFPNVIFKFLINSNLLSSFYFTILNGNISDFLSSKYYSHFYEILYFVYFIQIRKRRVFIFPEK